MFLVAEGGKLRGYRLSIVREVAEQYDFDGVHLDFLRHTPHLPPGKQWENREHLTTFMREVRSMLQSQAAKRGRPFMLAARVPDSVGSFFVSDDKGKNWRGPYRFNGLMENPHLVGTECTSRTGYLVTGPESCLIFMAARPKGFKKVRGQATGTVDGGKPSQWAAQWDKSYVAETTDGGKTFHFVSWIAPLSGPHRAVMPAVCRLKDGSIVATVRANRVERDAKGEGFMAGHVDAYGSADNGRTWTFLSRVGETGGKEQNGNPPALAALKDGRIACAYGDRRTAQIKARISSDGGKTWGDERVLRDDFQVGKDHSADLGYPRLVTNHDNHLVVAYWAVKLVDVQPDGFAQNIATGILRGRYRDSLLQPSPLEPNQAYEVTVDLGPCAATIATGHRLRVDICGSLFPLYDRNPNTGEGPFGAKTLVSTESVYHTSLKASRIVLPVKQ